MSQYPVEIPYSFSVDLSIRESQIPFVRTSVLTDNLPEEPIDFTPNQDTPVYQFSPTWYIYGDDTLLYIGNTIKYLVLGVWPYLSIGNAWRGKYIWLSHGDTRVHYKWISEQGSGYQNAIYWRSGVDYDIKPDTDWKWRINAPFRINIDYPPGSYLDLPYSTITIKRNTGLSTDGVEETIASGSKATVSLAVLTDNSADFSSVIDDYHCVRIISGTNTTPGMYKILAHTSETLTLDSNPGDSDAEDVVYSISESYAIAQGVNLNYDIPEDYTFPNMTKQMNRRRRYPNVQMTTSKVWLKVGINKYRLIVYGRFYKWTNKQAREEQGTRNYIEGVYNYVPYNFTSDYGWGKYRYWSIYKLDSYTETSKTIDLVLYEPEPNPSNVRLLVNYLNNSGQNEIRQYTIQT